MRFALGVFVVFSVFACTDNADTELRTPAPGADAAPRDIGVETGDSGNTSDEDAGTIADADVGTQCLPDCWLRSCADDGCGGSCGDCLPGATCVAFTGVCDCPESTCDGISCGPSSCGRLCGVCGDTEACSGGACVPAPDCAGVVCRDTSWRWMCGGQTIEGRCSTDPTRAALCQCPPDASGQMYECEDCFISVPIGCRNETCGEGTRCNAWSGRCEPAGVPQSGEDNGAPCASDSACRSAGGIGVALVPACRADWNGGYCMSYCNAPPGGFWSTNELPRSNCPEGSVCLPPGFTDAPAGFGGCLKECQSDSECREADGYYCRKNFRGGDTPNGYCAPDHCRSRGCQSFECGC